MKRKFILGTDWWTDCDDCVAVRLLCNAHKKGEIRLLGIGINACMEYSAPSLNAFLTGEGLGDIPIGIDLRGTDYEGDYHSYQKPLCQFPHSVMKNEDCPDAAELYKKLLRESDGKVDIIEIGFMTILSTLLESEGGVELFNEKVNTLYIMGGRWDRENGAEHNFNNNARSRKAAHILCEKCPVPIVFLGFEVGLDVLSADGLPDGDLLNLCVNCYGCGETGRHSWDPLTALLAVTGDTEKAGYSVASGKATVNPETGENNFEIGEGLHSYVVMQKPNEYYREEIQKRIQPIK